MSKAQDSKKEARKEPARSMKAEAGMVEQVERKR